jgi:hypothetical protein
MRTIREIMDIIGPDEDDDDFQRIIRERKIKELIKISFQKCDISISSDEDNSIWYDEEDNRTATVFLDDDEISLKTLDKLNLSGLSEDYKISFLNNYLVLIFSVNKNFDNVV